jgi:ABC-2 type transport system permease protein
MILGCNDGSTLLGLPNPVVDSREADFPSFKINGVPALSIVTIPILTSMVHFAGFHHHHNDRYTILQGGCSNQLGIFHLDPVLTANHGKYRMLIGVVSPNSRSIVLFSQAIFLPSMILGGLMVPPACFHRLYSAFRYSPQVMP